MRPDNHLLPACDEVTVRVPFWMQVAGLILFGVFLGVSLSYQMAKAHQAQEQVR